MYICIHVFYCFPFSREKYVKMLVFGSLWVIRLYYIYIFLFLPNIQKPVYMLLSYSQKKYLRKSLSVPKSRPGTLRGTWS